MLLQLDETLDLNEILTPLVSVLILILLMVLMVLVYMRLRVFLIILVIFLFSLVIGYYSLETSADIPFSPYLQIFFMVFQTVFFTLTTIKMFYYKGGKRATVYIET